jgi:hypothetical protein
LGTLLLTSPRTTVFLGHEAQRPKTAGALCVVLQQEAPVMEAVEKPLGDGVVSALAVRDQVLGMGSSLTSHYFHNCVKKPDFLISSTQLLS